jgi:hypothetical protein
VIIAGRRGQPAGEIGGSESGFLSQVIEKPRFLAALRITFFLFKGFGNGLLMLCGVRDDISAGGGILKNF